MKGTLKNTALIKDYFTFNRSEQRGIFVLVTLIMLLIAGSRILPYFIEEKTYDPGSSWQEIMDFEKELAIADSVQKAEYAGKRRTYPHYLPYTRADTFKSTKQETPIIVLELNAADTFDFQQLRGIGPGFARRIVKYRERLGGFIRVEQVLEVFGMDTARFEAIRKNLRADPDSVHPIDLNAVTFKELLKHPYFPFEITKSIMIYRKDHKVIKNVEELKAIKGISAETYQKIRPYVMVR